MNRDHAIFESGVILDMLRMQHYQECLTITFLKL